MRRFWGLAMVPFLGIAFLAEGGARHEPPRTVKNFKLEDASGKAWALHEQKSKAIVVVFLSTECPMSRGYLPVLSKLANDYRDKGVSVIGIFPDPDTSAKQLELHRKEFSIAFPVLSDPQQQAVQSLGAKVTPEVVLLDSQFRAQYRGRIDDRYASRLKAKTAIARHDLAEALEEILAGKAVSQPEAKAFGCPIALNETKKASENSTVTFHRDVVPILQKHCQACHRAGQIGPFELTSYKSTVKWAELCLEEINARRMPPWKPAPNPLLAGERTLPAEATKILQAWVERGMPEGNPAEAPKPLAFSDDWMLGKPDLILESRAETTVAASGPDLFQVQVFPTRFPEDKHIVAMEVKPGNPRVVHHTVQFIDTTGAARKLLADAEANQKPDDPDRGPGYAVNMGLGILPNPAGMLGGWAPGMLPKMLPDGVGQRLPRDGDICVQFHFHRTGKQETDRTRIGIYFAKKPVAQSFYMLPPNGFFWKIPAGEKNFKVDTSWRLTDDVTVYRLVPHMHLIGKDIELLMTPPGEAERSLIQIPEWDYNWQEQYELKEPLHLKAGTLLRVRATYDNSADNPMNPSHPPRVVTLGEQTTNEMCFVFMGIASTRMLPPFLAPVLK